METTEETKILVIYVGVANVRSEDIRTYVEAVISRIAPQTFKGEIIAIPMQSYDVKIECINPKYITDEELITEHSNMMMKLKGELLAQIEYLKANKNE